MTCRRCNGRMFRYADRWGRFSTCWNCGHVVDDLVGGPILPLIRGNDRSRAPGVDRPLTEGQIAARVAAGKRRAEQIRHPRRERRPSYYAGVEP